MENNLNITKLLTLNPKIVYDEDFDGFIIYYKNYEISIDDGVEVFINGSTVAIEDSENAKKIYEKVKENYKKQLLNFDNILNADLRKRKIDNIL